MRTAICAFSFVSSNGQERAVMTDPDVAPAAPKQEMVKRDGIAPRVFACTRGEDPVAFSMQLSYVYLAFW